jgi:hypothetical protein
MVVRGARLVNTMKDAVDVSYATMAAGSLLACSNRKFVVVPVNRFWLVLRQLILIVVGPIAPAYFDDLAPPKASSSVHNM